MRGLASSRGGTRRGAANLRIPVEDWRIALVSACYFALGAGLWVIQHELQLRTHWPLATLSGIFAFHLVTIRRSINDPVVVFALIMFIYSFIPMIADNGSPGSTLGFDLSEAFHVYNLGQLATMAAVGVTVFLIRPSLQQPAQRPNQSWECLIGGIVAGILGILLISASIASRGFVLGGDVSYSQSFTQQLEAGNGVYMLCIPLCLASIGLILASRHPLSIYFLCIPVIGFIEIAFGIGQRKYFLQPILFIFAFFWRAQSLSQVLTFIAGCVTAFLIFCYLGFLRLNSLGIEAVFNLLEWGNFFSNIGTYIGSETVYLYATAAAAVTRFVVPLEAGADYLLAWMISVPRFLLPEDAGELYTSANDRFTFAYNALEAVYGQGYGFSFLGEAYMVGGNPLIVGVVFAHVLLFRFLYVKGGGKNPTGFWGAIAIVSLYFAMWGQRNALGIVFKEFIVHVMIISALMFLCGKAAMMVIAPVVGRIRRDIERTKKVDNAY